MEVNETNRPLTETPMEQPIEAPVPTVEDTEKETSAPKQTLEEVVQRLKEINEKNDLTDKQEIDSLKQTFYKLQKAKSEAARKAFIDEGGKAEDFTPETEPAEEEFKAVMNAIKEKRNALAAAQEQEKEENQTKKLGILERMKFLTESQEDTNKIYDEFKKLQQEWNEIGQTPVAKVNELWKTYQLYTEKFYDMVKLNNEFREYDFKKNLEQKTRLCEAAEKLAEEPDVISAFHQLQKLHQEFRAIGPVAKDLREEIWSRFKAASTVVNKRHQQHFEELKEKEQNNLDQKTVICEIVEGMEYDTFTTFADWEDKTNEILALQAKWKTIGYAPQKKNIGPVAKKHSDAVWKRFIGACDYFFERKNKATSSQRSEEVENLSKKEDIIKRMAALEAAGTADDATAEQVRALMKEWNAIGFVPFKEKDRLYKEFHALVDKLFDRLHLSATEKRLSSVRTNGNKEGNLYRDRERLVRTYEGLKNDIQTYENNLGFLNSSSKKGNTLVADITRKIERLKKDMELVLKKIKDIDESLKDKE